MGQEDLQRGWRTSDGSGGPPTGGRTSDGSGGPPTGLEDPKSGSMGQEDLQRVWRTSNRREDLQRLWRTSDGSGGPPTGLEDPKSGSMGQKVLQQPSKSSNNALLSLSPHTVCRVGPPPPVAPEVQVLHASSCTPSQSESVELLCLVTGFSPASAEVEWLVDGVGGLLVASQSPAVRSGSTYSLSSRVNVSGTDWREGKSYSCRVRHPATNTVVEDHVKGCPGRLWGRKWGRKEGGGGGNPTWNPQSHPQ